MANTSLGAEDYYASLFGRCDPSKTGVVKVSMLLKTLRDLQALINESNAVGATHDHDVSNCHDELEELRKVLDPNQEDPGITLPMFVDGMTAYLEKREWSCLSPVKQKSEVSFVQTSSPQNKFKKQKPLDLDISQILMPEEEYKHRLVDISLEGVGGITTCSFDWQNEVLDLQLRIQKLTKDNDSLKIRLKEAHDENYNLLRSHREELHIYHHHEQELKATVDRVKLLEADLLDRKTAISHLEDKIVILENKNLRLDNQCCLYLKERRDLLIEIEELKRETKNTFGMLSSREEQIARLKTTQCSTTKDWGEREKVLKDRNDTLTCAINELEEKNIKLELEKSDLENKMNMFMLKEVEEEERHTFLQMSPTFVHETIIEESFEVSPDIETELMATHRATDSPLQMMKRCSGLHNPLAIERFDVAVQCEEKEVIDAAIQYEKSEHFSVTVQCDKEDEMDQFETVEDRKYDVQPETVPPTKGKLENSSFGSTVYGVSKHGISAVLMLVGLLALLEGYLSSFLMHNRSNSRSCLNPFFFKSARFYFSSCGDLIHEELPII